MLGERDEPEALLDWEVEGKSFCFRKRRAISDCLLVCLEREKGMEMKFLFFRSLYRRKLYRSSLTSAPAMANPAAQDGSNQPKYRQEGFFNGFNGKGGETREDTKHTMPFSVLPGREAKLSYIENLHSPAANHSAGNRQQSAYFPFSSGFPPR